MKHIIISFSVLFLCFDALIHAQGVLSTNFNPAGHGEAVVSFSAKNYEEFWAGDQIMGAPEQGLKQNIYSLYLRHAITDRLEAVVQLPFLANKTGAGQELDQKTQDISLFLKGKLYQNQQFTVGLGLGTNVATGYKAASLYSLGNGATTIDGILLADYTIANSVNIAAQAGYSIRNGDVPNAALGALQLAYSHPAFYASAGYAFQSSADGLDIGGPGFTGEADFPKAQVNYQTLSAVVAVPVVRRVEILAQYGLVLNGRNIGKANWLGIGAIVKW